VLGGRHPDEPPHFVSTFATHYVVRPGQHFYRVPDNVPDIIAASANCAMSQVYWGLDRARLGYGARTWSCSARADSDCMRWRLRRRAAHA
jgi:hypothetical protein